MMNRAHRVLRLLAVVTALGAVDRCDASETSALLSPAALPSPAETTEGVSGLRWAVSIDASPSNYRWSLSRGAFDIGMRFDMRPVVGRPLDAHFDAATPLLPTIPAVSLGLRSVSTRAEGTASGLLERAVGAGAAETYVRKVGIEWKPATSPLFLRQGLGIRLDSGDRVTMRLKKGSFGIYMQSNF